LIEHFIGTTNDRIDRINKYHKGIRVRVGIVKAWCVFW